MVEVGYGLLKIIFPYNVLLVETKGFFKLFSHFKMSHCNCLDLVFFCQPANFVLAWHFFEFVPYNNSQQRITKYIPIFSSTLSKLVDPSKYKEKSNHILISTKLKWCFTIAVPQCLQDITTTREITMGNYPTLKIQLYWSKNITNALWKI